MTLVEAMQIIATHEHPGAEYVILASVYSALGYVAGVLTGKLWCRIHNQRRKDCDHA